MTKYDRKKFSCYFFFHFRDFRSTYVLCDCDLMWFAYFRRNKAFETRHSKDGGKCANNNKTVSDLVPGDFDCIGMYNKLNCVHV